MGILEDQALENWFAVIVGLVGLTRGEWLIDHIDQVPSSVPVSCSYVVGHEHVGCQQLAKTYRCVARMLIVPRFQRGNLGQSVVPILVGGADQMLTVDHQHVPDYDGVFDGAVFLV